MDVSSETRVVSEIVAGMVGIIVNDDWVSGPVPIRDIGEIGGRDGPIPTVEPEAVGSTADKPPDVTRAKTTVVAPVFPGAVQMVPGVTPAGVVPDPASGINMRGLRMARLIAEVPLPLLAALPLLGSLTLLRLLPRLASLSLLASLPLLHLLPLPPIAGRGRSPLRRLGMVSLAVFLPAILFRPAFASPLLAVDEQAAESQRNYDIADLHYGFSSTVWRYQEPCCFAQPPYLPVNGPVTASPSRDTGIVETLLKAGADPR